MQICWKFSLLNLKIVLRKIGGDGVEGGSTTNVCQMAKTLQSQCITLQNIISVARLGDFLNFGQIFKAFGSNYFAQISHILRQFL